MAELKDLYTGTFVVVFCIVLILLIYYYHITENIFTQKNTNQTKIQYTDVIRSIKQELKPVGHLHFMKVTKSCISGIMRGFLMGLLIGGVEGAVVSSVSLGLVNPIMLVLEHHV
jgi:hypothetical protein